MNFVKTKVTAGLGSYCLLECFFILQNHKCVFLRSRIMEECVSGSGAVPLFLCVREAYRSLQRFPTTSALT